MPKYQFMSKRWEHDRPRIPTHARIVLDHRAKEFPIYDEVETYDGKTEKVCNGVQFYHRLFIWWTHPHVEHLPQYKLTHGVNFNCYEVNGWSNKLTLVGRFLTDSCEGRVHKKAYTINIGLPELIVFNCSDVKGIQDFFMDKIYNYIVTPRISPRKLGQIALFYAPQGSRISFRAVKKFLATTQQGKKQIRKKLLKYKPLKNNLQKKIF
jgi:hypothetical protein